MNLTNTHVMFILTVITGICMYVALSVIFGPVLSAVLMLSGIVSIRMLSRSRVDKENNE